MKIVFIDVREKNIEVQAQEKTQSPATPRSNKVANKCKRSNKKPEPEESPSTIREVMIIEVSSDEEEESTISENENVESWMLLGCEEDDKDNDILLNLVGCKDAGAEGENDVNWFISDKDIEAKIDNNRSSGRWNNRYYSVNKNVTCRNCDKRGHLSKKLPLTTKSPALLSLLGKRTPPVWLSSPLLLRLLFAHVFHSQMF